MTSFEDALKKLELEEEDLKRLISAGEIRAFREGSNMRLDVADVDKVAEQLGIGSAVSEADASAVVEVEELSLDADDGMVTTQLSEEDTLLDSVIEDVPVEEAASASKSGGSRSARGKSAGAKQRGSNVTVLPATELSDEGGGLRAALIFTAVVLLFAIPFAIGMISGHSSGITQGVVDMFAN